MNGYTSGTQALQGRTVNHDPAPWVNVVGDSRSIFGPERFPENEYNYDPRPEFAVLDNPILADVRHYAYQNGTQPKAVYAAWLGFVLNDDEDSWEENVTTGHIEHARRVLTLLMEIYK